LDICANERLPCRISQTDGDASSRIEDDDEGLEHPQRNQATHCTKTSAGIGLYYKQRRPEFADLIGILCGACDRKAGYQCPDTVNFNKRD